MKQIGIRADKLHFYEEKWQNIKNKGSFFSFLLKKNSNFEEICEIKEFEIFNLMLEKYVWGAKPLKQIFHLTS